METTIDLKELLDYINPSELNYQEWVNVGMALKAEGYDVSVWDDWSRRDAPRYHQNECEKKWDSFNGSPNPVTGATIVQMAKDNGWRGRNKGDYELEWDSEIGTDIVVVDKNWIDGKEIQPPKDFQPHKQLIQYLETLFEAGENVGYVVESWEKDGKYLPANKGCYDRTAGKLIELLSKCNGDIGSVLGDYNTKAGAWIRFNPLDGKDVRDVNVTEYRYALIESDDADIEKQNAIIRELELPVACLVYSGSKSLHAIVKIDALDYSEYRKRVDYLYSVCQKNGLTVDRSNKNPSRLSRMPGVMRGDKMQYIVDTNIGKQSYAEWKEWIESVNDDLPDPECMSAVWDNMPELSPPLIDGILRQGHKMLIAGPSKAGKSYALIELCCAIAEGQPWFGFPCAKGKVMYVNLELDRASCLHRFKDVYTALGLPPKNLTNIDIWNLRGRSIPMDRLAPKLIRRALKKDYIAIIIDPIYKVITGDENSADQKANFCNQFDKGCTELGCAVIYCHHHSKGAQGGKRSMDRASGSGVFARDPDALIDLIELETTEDLIKQERNNAACRQMVSFMQNRGLADEISQDDECSQAAMRELCRKFLRDSDYAQVMINVAKAQKDVENRTAWRIEGTLREFPKFPPINLWFDYPIHRVDGSEVLKDLSFDGSFNSKNSPYKNNFKKKKSKSEMKEERKDSLNNAFDCGNIDSYGEVFISEICEYMGKSEDTVRRWIKEFSDEFYMSNGKVGRKELKPQPR